MNFVTNIFDVISFTPESIASLVLFLVAVFVLVISIVVFFHWRRYGLNKSLFAIIEIVYLLVCVLFLSTAFYSL